MLAVLLSLSILSSGVEDRHVATVNSDAPHPDSNGKAVVVLKLVTLPLAIWYKVKKHKGE